MKYCPHCRKPSARTSGKCPHCGKDLELGPGAAAKAGASGYESMSAAEPETGPLQLDHHSRPAPAVAVEEVDDPYQRHMESLDDEPELELDTSRPLAKATPAPTPRPSGFGIPVIPSFTREEPPDYDPDELHEKARYGAPPSSLLGAVSYALAVRKRSAELLAEAARLEPGVARAREELIEEMARLGERARVAGYKGSTQDIAALLAAVEAADRTAENAEGAKSVEQRRHAQAMEEIEARIESVRERMEAPRLKEAQLAAELGAKEGERRQLEMRIKRLEIEIRAAEEVAARGQTSGAQQPAADPAALRAASAKLPGLQSELQALRARASHLDDPIAELRARVARAHEELGALKAERAAAAKAREDELALHQANTRGASTQSEQARQELKLYLAEIGRAVRMDRNAPSWAYELYPDIDERAHTYGALWNDRQLCLASANAFDRSTVQKGYVVMLGSAGLAFALVIGLLVLASNL